MMTSELVKLICAKDGVMLYDDLISGFRNGFYIDSVTEGNESFATVLVNGQKMIMAKTGVKLCRAKNCNGCMNLHLCKFFLLGDCQYGRGR